MSSLSIIDKSQNHTHLRHFVVQTRTFQIEKARNVQMYGNLRVYIKKQNEKKKQEMEMSAELKRARREKELKHKRDKSTLGEIKEEIERETKNLERLTEEKHRLFTEFKKVLGDEDEKRKNLQLVKDTAAAVSASYHNNLHNVTFGIAPTVPANIAKQPQLQPYQAITPPTSTSGGMIGNVGPPVNISSNNIICNVNNIVNAPSTILPGSMQIHQSMFFAPPLPHPSPQQQQQQHSSIVSNLIASSNASQINQSHHHRMNGRVPTPTSSYSSSPKSSNSNNNNMNQSLIYSKSMPPHPSAVAPSLSMASISSASPSMSTSSPLMIPAQSSSPFANERHRLQSYKRTHEHASSSPVNFASPSGAMLSIPPPSGPGPSVITGQPSHLHYLQQNYKPSLSQLTPGAFAASLGGQHGISNLDTLQSAYYPPLFPYALPPGASTHQYLNNSNPK